MRRFKIKSVRKNVDDNKEAVCDLDNVNQKVQERYLKHWIIKVLVLTLVLLTVSVVLTFLYLSVTNKSSIKESTIGLFLQTLSEIIKIILAPT
jgi:hypothetical protein